MEEKRGLRYVYPPSMYPRYKYFQEHLGSVVERLSRIIGAELLQEFVLDGPFLLTEILNLTTIFAKHVSVLLFADDSFLKSKRLELTIKDMRKMLETVQTPEEISWSLIMVPNWSFSVGKPELIVYVPDSSENEALQELRNRMSTFDADQQQNVIVYLKDADISYKYTDLACVDFAYKVLQEPVPLNKMIQEQLEHKIVAVFEKILHFIKVFVPRSTVQLNKSLADSVTQKLDRCLGNAFVVNDLSPSDVLQDPANQILTLTEKTVLFHKRLTGCISKASRVYICDYLSKQFGLSGYLINEFLNMEQFGYDDKIHKMLEKLNPSWPKNNNGLLACISMRTEICDGMLEFLTKFEEFVKQKMKVLNVVRKLQFEIFGLLNLSKVPLEVHIPQFQKLAFELQYELLNIPEVFGCGTYYGQLMLHMTAELDANTRKRVKKILLKYHYPHIYTHERISKQQEQILVQKYRQGSELQAVKNVSAVVPPPTNSSATEDTKFKYGSLGCFVYIQNNVEHCKAARDSIQAARDSLQASGVSRKAQFGTFEEIHVGMDKDRQSEISAMGKLYCITCAHCIQDCLPTVNIRDTQSFVELGSVKYYMFHPQGFDIAAIEINDKYVRYCDINLKKPQDHIESMLRWSLNENNPIGRTVYKIGSQSDVTRGLVVSTDYMTKIIKEIECGIDPNFSLSDLVCSIIIESLPDISELELESKPFSQPGDSGSVVCDEVPDDSSVTAISILQGAVLRQEGQVEKFMFSYSADLKKNFSQLEHKYNIIISPAYEP